MPQPQWHQTVLITLWMWNNNFSATTWAVSARHYCHALHSAECSMLCATECKTATNWCLHSKSSLP